ncbi:hypothetical protein C2U27_19360 [Bacillus aerophilus]|nr:hypothetical protein [Bacillus aerophilus]NOL34011.1 hypothetical protein [Bacillus altitudinis]RFB48955.1 hypothetical protein DZB74_01095 [Bacillus sp. HMG]TYO53790.1 hypothetical protein FXF70_01105 [Bacillus sp. Y3]QKL23004.1 hypothetical protein RI02_15385 [Bacillus altitudinis]
MGKHYFTDTILKKIGTKKQVDRLSTCQRVDKPSHSLSVLRAGAHECQIRSAPVLVLPRLQRFSITLKKRRQRAKIKFILALCQQSNRWIFYPPVFFYSLSDCPRVISRFLFFPSRMTVIVVLSPIFVSL